MTRTHFLILFLLMNFGELLFGQTGTDDPLVGYFENTESQLGLTVKKEGKQYSGDFIFQGQSYPFKEGIRFLGVLSASYAYNGNLIPFSLSGSGTEFQVISEGVTIPVTKKSNEPVAPAATPTPKPLTATATSSVKVPAASGTTYKDPFGAYTFQLPAGCTAKQTAEGFEINCGMAGIEMTVSSHAYTSTAAVKKDAVDVNDAASGVSLKAKTSDYNSNGVFVRYEGKASGTPVVIESLVLVSPHGGGASVAAKGGTLNYTATVTAIIKSIGNSMQFTKPTVSADAQQWITKLKGKQLLYLYTASGYSEKYSYDLCVNNTFVSAGDNSYTSTGYGSNASGVTSGGGSGTWKIISKGSGSALVLTFNNGEVKSFDITARSASNEVGLNGKRYFIQASTSCN